jgi:hypothetical protein
MPFKVEDPNNEGQEIEVFTPEEVAAKEAELVAAKEEVAQAKAEAEKYQKVSAEKTDNFKKLNEMTEAEKATLSAEKIEALKRFEASEARAKALEDKINQDTETRIKTDTETALSKYHGGDENLKKALEANFKMIGLEGNDTATIQERARLAAAMEAGKSGRANPLMAPMSGDSPRMQNKSATDEFLKSEKAKEAMKRMGDL